ncbi:MAG: hypothetical protein KC620_14575, partial [Myxococcales bacterium]|nr:hypothetical protein [Myxococcales bacterium]
TCDAVAGEPGVETCDGADDDCDGTVDEGFRLGQPCSGGVGACTRPGQFVCVGDGTATCDARPGAPAPEACKAADDDCDGRTDEGLQLGEACAEGVGACRAEGVRACDANGGAHCTAEPGAPQAERCNGIDDDCDGRSEEGLGLGEACTEGIGACARTGRFICDNNGGVTCSVRAGPSAAETCNAIDDDCDGRTDETFPLGAACAVGLGRCERAGVFICAGGAAVCDVSPGDRRDERCDGIDDDCDGRTDEDFPLGRPCTEGIGACLRRGAEECTADGTGTQCSASAGEPQPDTCNAIDDDCDGTTDEDYPLGAACTVGLGECRNRGGFICGDDGDAVCDVDPLPAAVERCDGRDEDCDGRVDEDFDLGGACVVGLGICARPGVKVCAPDGTGDCQGLVGPPEEEGCDDLDNDCDGLVDEGEGPQAGEAFALCGPRYRSCLDALRAGRVQSGVYRISPVDHAGQLVYCDQTTDGGGWTLVGNTRTTPLLDQLSPWYDDLTRLVPQAAHAGIWNGLAHLDEQAFDVRFACRAAPPGAERQFDVDLAFYGTPWYREFIIGPDAQTCFLPGDQVAAEPAPARRDLNTGEVRANGQPYAGAAGRLVGERRCANETDFAVDFDDQGIGGVVDATDWGAQARVPRCGGLAVNNGHWLVFARESQARGLGRIGLLGVPSLEQPVRAAGFEPVLLDYDADALMDALDPETLPAIFIGRYAHDWALFSDGVRQSLSDYNAAGGSVVTEYDGASLFASRMDPEFLYADGAPDVMEWVTALVGHGGERGPATPIHHLVIGDPVLRGVPDPFASAEGTQRFLTYSRSHSTLPIDMRPLAWFAGDDGEWPDAVNYALLRGVRCEGNLLFGLFDYADAPLDPAIFRLVGNLAAAAISPPPADVEDICSEVIGGG